jgi:hypothetical protein
MDDVKLLFKEVSAPESGVTFDPALRATPATIQSRINPPSWIWPNEAARQSQTVTADDVGKYGIQTDVNADFQLSAATPATWQPRQVGTRATWTWANQAARTAQVIAPTDIGKYGVQSDINTLFQLTAVTPATWQPIPNGNNTSSPLELSNGAADADSYHDFYRLQIAFQEVWGELMDATMNFFGEDLYAKYDALMSPDSGYPYYFDDSGNDGTTGRKKTYPPLPLYQTDINGNVRLDNNGVPIPFEVSGADELQQFIDFLKIQFGISSDASPDVTPQIAQLRSDLVRTLEGCNMLLSQLARLFDDMNGNSGGENGATWLHESPTNEHSNLGNSWPSFILPSSNSRETVFNDIIADLGATPTGTASNDAFTDLVNLVQGLDKMLAEPYRFDVFAPDSINYGVLLNYRQHWQPQSYQVGNLVSTIPLAPQETRRYTTKTVIKKTRNVKEIDDSMRTTKDESSTTWRVDSEIVERAKNQTNFQKNASGSFGNDAIYKVSAGTQQSQDQAVESAQTKRDFHESVVKAAQEYRNEHRIEISTEETREDEATSFREIRNPNDELTVTYLFYELQRRYLVDEALHKATPVILVANDVPAPHEVDSEWLLRHDWIIKRAILDASFLPALDYLSANYTGEELELQVLGLAVEQQKAVVDRISLQVQSGSDALNAATARLETAENKDVSDKEAAETASFVKSFFDPLGLTQSGGDGNSDRARVDYAKDTLNRTQAKVDQLVAQLKTEATALQVAIDKYVKAATKHFTMLAEIDRLRIHVKDNIIYYMQAIWTYEPADQRFFRLYNVEVPDFSHNTTVGVAPAVGLAGIDPTHSAVTARFPVPTLNLPPTLLHQVADLENLLGFKGNYMIFPMVKFNYMTWFLMQNYLHLDDVSGVTAQDPDPLAGLTVAQLKTALANIYAKNPASFNANQPVFEEIMTRLLSTADPQMVVVPSNSLYIEALPGTHPLLEDFKLIHRAIDIKKVQAEARHAELENLRLAARLANKEYGDPDIDKVVVVGGGKNVTVDAG